MLAAKLQFTPASHDEDIKQKDHLTFHTLLKKNIFKIKINHARGGGCGGGVC